MGRRRRDPQNALPPRVYLRHGAYFWVNPADKRWVRLGTDLSEALAEHRRLAPATPTIGPPLDWTKSKQTTLAGVGRELRLATTLSRNAKSGARSRGIPYSLSLQHVLDLIHQADGRCMLTAIPFSDEIPPGASKRLWRPSLDRIESSNGYVPGNVRLVCVLANISLLDHGDALFEKLARGFLEQRLLSSSPPTDAGTQVTE